MGQIQFTVSLIFIGLFSIALIGFAINFAEDNDSVIDIRNDPEISGIYTGSITNLSNFDEGAEKTYGSIVNSSVSEGGTTTQSGGQFAITPVSSIAVLKNIFKVGYTKIFGTGAGFGIFMTTFLGLIVFIMGLYIWKTLAGRSPD